MQQLTHNAVPFASIYSTHSGRMGSSEIISGELSAARRIKKEAMTTKKKKKPKKNWGIMLPMYAAAM